MGIEAFEGRDDVGTRAAVDQYLLEGAAGGNDE